MENSQAHLKYESHFIDLNASEQLHLKRIFTNPEGEAVFLVHGFLENGRIFYTDSGKGWACFLAKAGYDVFIADLRGRGLSRPRISRASHFGQQEFLTEEMPAFLNKVKSLKGNASIHWGAHSWGGVMLLAWLAENESPMPLKSLVFFGTKRRITVRNWHYFWMIRVAWRGIFKWIARRKGYLEVVKYKLGGDNESKGVFEETDRWVREKAWLHWESGFDYAAALQSRQLPPVLYLAGQKDHVLGHPKDVRLLAGETGSQIKEVHLLSKANGYHHDYGHINMLTHKDAPKDHFPYALEWMKLHGGKP